MTTEAAANAGPQFSIYLPNYPMGDYHIGQKDRGFIQNHIDATYPAAVRGVLEKVRDAVRGMEMSPLLAVDFRFNNDVGVESYAVRLHSTEIMTFEFENGQHPVVAPFAAKDVLAGLEQEHKRYQDQFFRTTTPGVEYPYNQAMQVLRTLVSELALRCTFHIYDLTGRRDAVLVVAVPKSTPGLALKFKLWAL